MKYLSFIPKVLHQISSTITTALALTYWIAGGVVGAIAALVVAAYGVLGFGLGILVLKALAMPNSLLRNWAVSWDPEYANKGLLSNIEEKAKEMAVAQGNGLGDLSDIANSVRNPNSNWADKT